MYCIISRTWRTLATLGACSKGSKFRKWHLFHMCSGLQVFQVPNSLYTFNAQINALHSYTDLVFVIYIYLLTLLITYLCTYEICAWDVAMVHLYNFVKLVLSFNFMWVMGIEHRSSGLDSKCFYPLSHLIGPVIFTLHLRNMIR